jgi:hypothetical protein
MWGGARSACPPHPNLPPHRGEGGEGGLEPSSWQAFLGPFPYVGISARQFTAGLPGLGGVLS